MMRKYKYTVLLCAAVLAPLACYVLWMLYGWMFVDVRMSNDNFVRTMLAMFGLIVGAGAATVIKYFEDLER